MDTQPSSRRRFVLPLVLALALGVGTVPTARADDAGSACGTPKGQTSTGEVSCHLHFRGFPLQVFAEAEASEAAEVRVWLTAAGTDVILAECTSKGSGYASCSKSEPDEAPTIDHPLLSVTSLTCHAVIDGTGGYRCLSGSGQ